MRLHDLRCAKLYWLKTVQRDTFATEIEVLQTNAQLKPSNPLANLNPYLNPDGLLRVGGRLHHANIGDSCKHPILLRAHPVIDLIIRHHHHLTLHGGLKLTLISVRHEFWIIRARAMVGASINCCVHCARAKAATPTELMGNLPSIRVNPAPRAFTHTGVDYAGSIVIRTTPGRGHRTHKAYIALFVCMTVKAIHLELVSDYSSAAFLAAYHRFVARRGIPTIMYSDNGTTFQGASNELRKAFAAAIRQTDSQSEIATAGTQWQFLPPNAPHFGGLWEAGVKSVKYHLRRCIEHQTLTFEEMTTLLCRIEACLNSRPLAPLSDYLDGYLPLTPGHFLIAIDRTA